MHSDTSRRRLRTWHYLAILFIIVVGTYYYIFLHGDFISLDDKNIIGILLNHPPLVLKDLFFPQGTVKYFRPLVDLSFRFDHFLWFDIASGYHLTNVLFHLLNVYFVYLLADILFFKVTEHHERAAFYAAALFAIHPLATESVCWVAGRSDLIAASLLLPSFILYLLFKRNGHSVYLIFSGLLFFLAAMTKETALALPIVILLFELVYHPFFLERKRGWVSFMPSGLFFLLTVLYFVIFRNGGIDTTNARVNLASDGYRVVSYAEKIPIFFASVGFYVKKLIVPYPLNFAIQSIHVSTHAVLGVIVLVLFALCGIFRARRYSFFAAWILVALSPAIAAAVLMIPWVPWAERYLYIPLAGVCLAAGLWMVTITGKRKIVASLMLVFIAGIFWPTTLHRTYLWADEEKLWSDTVAKTDYGPVYYYYGKALLDNGKEKEAVEQFEKAIARGFSYHPYLEIAQTRLNKKDINGVEAVLNKAIHEYPSHPEFHRHLADGYLFMIPYAKNNRDQYYFKAIDEYKRYLNAKHDDAAINFKLAQLYRTIKKPQRAVPYLKRVIKIAPGSRYANAASRILEPSRKLVEK